MSEPTRRALVWAALALSSCGIAQAQALRLPNAGSGTGLLAVPAASQAIQEADHITAVVNSAPLTANEVRTRAASVERQLRERGEPVPPRAELLREVLELLVVEQTQLQRAEEIGIRIETSVLDQAEADVAEQNQMDLKTFRERLAREGIDNNRLREQIRRQITLQRLREREVESVLRVTDRDVDNYLQSQPTPSAAPEALNLGHILVALPERAGPDEVASKLARAMRASERAAAGEDFAKLAQEFSDGPERQQGGAMGLRTPDRYPELFAESTRNLKVGQVTGPLRSGAGFHVLKVLERKASTPHEATVTQTRARHILLRASRQTSQQATTEQMRNWRNDIVNGKADFATLAREHSQDGSAKGGGDLGWANPGLYVPEFELAMNALALNEVSEPVVSRFGVHLIQVLERRQVPQGLKEKRDAARPKVREEMLERAYAEWARDLRAKAYVEYREPAR
jgi:peptidyl-prolyl cis-trans isomerase SurA